MTALTRSEVVETVTDKATTAWRRWQPFYGPIDGPLVARPKPFHKVVGLVGVVASAALASINPAWSIDVHHDAKLNPVMVEIRGVGCSPVFVPIKIERRQLRLASPGWGEGELPVVGLASKRAGADFLTSLAQVAAIVLVDVDMESRGRRVC